MTKDTAIERFARGPLWGAIFVAGSWHVFNDLPATITKRADYSSPAVGELVWLVFAVIGVIAAVDLLRNGRRRFVLPTVGVAVLLCTVIAQLVVCKPILIFHVGDWGWSNCGWIAMLLLWRWPVGWLFGAMGMNIAVALATLLTVQPLGAIGVARFFTIAYSSSAIELGVAWGARVLERRAASAFRAKTEQDAIATRQHAERIVHLDRQRRYHELGQDLRLVLAELAGGRAAPDDTAVRRRCAIEASRLRRLIAEHHDASSRLIYELRACADIAERRDVEVSLENGGGAARAAGRDTSGTHRSAHARASGCAQLGADHRRLVSQRPGGAGQRGGRR